MSHVNELLSRFGTQDGELTVGGTRTSLLAERAGGTPFFAYDRAQMTDRVAQVRAALPDEVRLSYAVKANPMPAVVQHLSRIVDKFDVASAAEMRVALDTGIDADHISFAGPGKTVEELRSAVAAGVTIELESSGELARAVAAAELVGRTPRVAIRVNPPFAVKGSGMRMGGGAQQFGVDAERVPELMADISGRGLDLVGFHVFAGSQNLDAEVLVASQRATLALIAELVEGRAEPVDYVNLGGGFGIPYTDRDEPLDLPRLGAELGEAISAARTGVFSQTTFVVELGRYLVGEAGVYVTRVIDRKESRGKTFLVVDGGLHHQLAASGNFGQVIRRNYPIVVASKADAAAVEEVDVVGCSCTPLDMLGAGLSLPTAEPGDLIAIFQAGAYGLTASPTRFLSHPEAQELVV